VDRGNKERKGDIQDSLRGVNLENKPDGMIINGGLCGKRHPVVGVREQDCNRGSREVSGASRGERRRGGEKQETVLDGKVGGSDGQGGGALGVGSAE